MENFNVKFNSNVKIIPLHITPLKTVVDREKKISDFLNLGELYDATKMIDKNDLFTKGGIPIDSRLLKAHTYIRKQLGNPLYIGSAYRETAWEKKQGRTGTSQHALAQAMDFNGKGLIDFIENAIETQNEHYTFLRSIGINAFGIYDWGVHLDTRNAKSGGNIYFWDERKKKNLLSNFSENSIFGIILTFAIFYFLSKKSKLKSKIKRKIKW